MKSVMRMAGYVARAELSEESLVVGTGAAHVRITSVVMDLVFVISVRQYAYSLTVTFRVMARREGGVIERCSDTNASGRHSVKDWHTTYYLMR